METVSSRKKGAAIEQAILRAFLRQPLCQRSVAALALPDFAAYRDQRLAVIRPSTLRKEFSILHHMFRSPARNGLFSCLLIPHGPAAGNCYAKPRAAAPTRRGAGAAGGVPQMPPSIREADDRIGN
jgi:hypothetical protein